MCIAAAVIAGAVIGAAGSAIAGSEAKSGVENAANTAAAEQQSALTQEAALSKPYRDLGTGAISQLQALTGTGPGGPNAAAQQATLANTPGYQFTKSQGITSVENAASAMGLTLSGNTLQGIDEFTTGLADQTYQNTVGNLEWQVGQGQAAAAGQAANVQAGATNLGNIALGEGTNLANINMNEILGISKSLGGAGTNYLTLNALLNKDPSAAGPG